MSSKVVSIIVNFIFISVMTCMAVGLGYLIYCSVTAIDEGPYIVKVYTISGKPKYQYIGTIHRQKHTRLIIHITGEYPDN